MERKMIGMRRGKERGQGWKGIEKQKGVGGGNEGTGVGSEGKWGKREQQRGEGEGKEEFGKGKEKRNCGNWRGKGPKLEWKAPDWSLKGKGKRK